MTDQIDAYGALDGATLTIQRRLPGPIERVWSYLTESDLRRQWLAAGDMKLETEGPFELVWRNDELSEPGQRPAGFPEEQRLAGRVKAAEPPHKLVITWGEDGEVSFDLAPVGNSVVLTLVHRRLPGEAVLPISAGWHTHLDILAARTAGDKPQPFWPTWQALRQEYEARFAKPAA